MSEHIETLIIGGGQSGLAVASQLKRSGRPVLILEANERVGDSWRKRWDSLRVFSPAKFNGLPGMRFPAPRLSFPTKDAVADYQASYARRFELPVRTSTRVDSLDRRGDRYVVTAGASSYEADNVVIATGACQVPKIPEFATDLNRAIKQMHSSEYKSAAQLPEGDVLVVGIGNSGAEIAKELARTRRVWLAGRAPREMPFEHGTFAAVFAQSMIKFLGMYVLNVDTPVGRKAQPQFLRHGPPLIRVKTKDLLAAGVERVQRVTGVRDGMPLLADGRALDMSAVIWCTGFKSDFDWVHLDVFGEDGRPVQYRGVVQSSPGLYFVGLEFQYAAASGVLPGIVRDAGYVARHIAARVAAHSGVQVFGEYVAVSMPK